ncbi:unnamed protein product [Orchesella dallaii]|uniref:Uncharacterized protein n=1 Tax=Orchesella dallaii TaxID=48710 RepID=A0ABP1S083_9HEXA
MKSKPWNCEVNLITFPNTNDFGYAIDSWHKPEYWDKKHPNFAKGYKRMMPSLASVININIILEEDHSKWLKDGITAKWLQDNVSPFTLDEKPSALSANKVSKLYSSMDMHILILTSNCTLQIKFWSICQLTKILALQSDFEGRTISNKGYLLQAIAEFEIKLSYLASGLVNSNVTNLFFPTKKEMLVIRPIEQRHGDGTFQIYLETCQNQQSFFSLVTNSELEDRFPLILLNILQSVIQNYTYIFPEVHYLGCKNGAKIKVGYLRPPIYMRVARLPQANNFEFALIKMSDIINTLAFVSCGKAKISGFAFSELLNVFEAPVWYFILLSYVILAASTYLMENFSYKNEKGSFWGFESFVSIINQTLKPLLEQGDPFKSALVAETGLRLSIGAYLLVGIVLSNAYKNTNVYNMISPRPPVPYENLSQLVRDEFSIFSRGKIERNVHDDWRKSIVLYSYPSLEEISYDSTLNFVNDCPDCLKGIQNFRITSEIWTSLNNLAENRKDNRSIKEIEIFNQLKHNVTLVPGLVSIMRDMYQQLWPNNVHDIFSREYKRFLSEAENLLNRKQKMLFNELIVQCNNTALIMPRVEANRLARNIQTTNQDDVYVGKENYYGWDYLIYFVGHVPPFVIEGIGAMQWNGIANKLVEFAASTYKPSPYRSSDPTKATMQGNVAVIFVIQVSGLVIAFLVFLVELRESIFKFLSKFLCEIRRSWRWFKEYTHAIVRRTKIDVFDTISDL